ncbi:MAG: putative membrane protein YdjX (TVP38/TMEM64 family) [Planctomycetota bacterium]
MDDLIATLIAMETLPRASLYFVVFVTLNALFVPATFLSVASGFLLPLPVAIPLAMFSRSFTAFTCSFLSRYFIRDFVQKKIGNYARIQGIERALSREGWKGVILLRLSPIFPSGPSNYVLGVTSIPLWSIALGTLVGTFPNTILCAIAGAGLETLTQIRKFQVLGSTYGPWLLGLGVVATIVLIWQIRRRIQRSR